MSDNKSFCIQNISGEIVFYRADGKLKIKASNENFGITFTLDDANNSIDDMIKKLTYLKISNFDILKEKLEEGIKRGFSLYEMEDLRETKVEILELSPFIRIKNGNSIIVINDFTVINFVGGKLEIQMKYKRTYFFKKEERFDF